MMVEVVEVVVEVEEVEEVVEVVTRQTGDCRLQHIINILRAALSLSLCGRAACSQA